MAIPAENQHKLPRTFKVALNQLLILTINFIAFVGIVLIVYSITADISQSKYDVIEKIATPLAVFCTVLGTLIAAASIYMPENTRKPEAFSIYISAPLVILFCFAVLWFYFYEDLVLPEHFLNGIALIGLSGGLFRIISREVQI